MGLDFRLGSRDVRAPPKVALRRPDRIRQLGKNSAVNALVRACEDPTSIHADDPQGIWWTEDDELPVGCTW